jgi:hypothetical protein
METGEQFGIALEPDVKSLVGNQMVPYIYEDLISHEKLTEAFVQMYEWGPDKRKEIGMRALEHAHKDYDLEQVIEHWDKTLTQLLENWKSSDRRWEVKSL